MKIITPTFRKTVWHKREIKLYSSESEAVTANEYGFLGLTDAIKLPNPKTKEAELIETSVGRLILNT